MTGTRAALACAVAASVAAAVGWARTPPRLGGRAPSIRIVDVRPLRSPDPRLRDTLSHYVSVRVTTSAWPLRAQRADVSGLDPRPRLRHWRLYLDGYPVAETFTDTAVTPYLVAGTHWFAAELRDADHDRLRPTVWSEPWVVRVPRSYSARR